MGAWDDGSRDDGVLWARDLVLTHPQSRGRQNEQGDVAAVRDVSLSVRGGQTLVLSGPTASGKSTVVHCLAGILAPDSGEVWFDGRPVHGLGERARRRLRRSAFGIVPQFGDLVPDLTVEENVALPLLLAGRPSPAALAAAGDWLRRLEMDDVARYRARRLTADLVQRAAVARALAAEPRVVLADEPTGPLTAREGGQVLRILTTAARSHGFALVLATRDRTLSRYADVHVELREGTVVTGTARALSPTAPLADSTEGDAADTYGTGRADAGDHSAAEAPAVAWSAPASACR